MEPISLKDPKFISFAILVFASAVALVWNRLHQWNRNRKIDKWAKPMRENNEREAANQEAGQRAAHVFAKLREKNSRQLKRTRFKGRTDQAHQGEE